MSGHGTHSIHIEGQMITGKVNGSHNEYDAAIVTGELRKAVESLNGLPYVELIDARELQGVTPEGYAIIGEYNEWESANGLIAIAFVANNEILALIVKHYLSTTHDMNMKDFSDIEEAKLWLQSELQKDQLRDK